jgi:hypothetical protein
MADQTSGNPAMLGWVVPRTPLEIVAEKRVHLDRLATQGGSSGEVAAIAASLNWIPRPRGVHLRALLTALTRAGTPIKGTSFDAIAYEGSLDFENSEAIDAAASKMTFIEIKAANQSRVRPGFGGFFFAITESEIAASDALGVRHRVALYNRTTGELLITSVPEILSRAKSTTWQVSVQL